MKNILFVITTALSLTAISSGFEDSSYNWNNNSNSSKQHANTQMKAKNMSTADSIYQKYNRNNTVSLADISDLGKYSTYNHSSSHMMSYDDALADLKMERKKVKKVGFEWNTIGKLMKKAKKLHKKGNDNKAIKLLTTAKKHAMLGLEQAMEQANAGPRF